VSVPEDSLALKPANITFEQAAAVPTSGLITLQNLPNEGRLQSGQRVLVNGAGGGVGALAVQIAKAYGAEVTGVDNTKKLEMVRSLGADHVIDYTKEDFTQGGERYDLIFDIPATIRFRLVAASSPLMGNTFSSDMIASGKEPAAGSEACLASSSWSRSLRS
jgi:NADPH:quinone reductase-like Zn-dependent oxidoreductase